MGNGAAGYYCYRCGAAYTELGAHNCKARKTEETASGFMQGEPEEPIPPSVTYTTADECKGDWTEPVEKPSRVRPVFKDFFIAMNIIAVLSGLVILLGWAIGEFVRSHYWIALIVEILVLVVAYWLHKEDNAGKV
jgi:hypothetical protein